MFAFPLGKALEIEGMKVLFNFVVLFVMMFLLPACVIGDPGLAMKACKDMCPFGVKSFEKGDTCFCLTPQELMVPIRKKK